MINLKTTQLNTKNVNYKHKKYKILLNLVSTNKNSR